ncbi:hypothetical protein D3C72_2572540 [compost metagenome]
MDGCHLLEPDRGSQAAGAAAHDDHVVFHCFTGTILGEDFFVRHGFFVVRLIIE